MSSSSLRLPNRAGRSSSTLRRLLARSKTGSPPVSPSSSAPNQTVKAAGAKQMATLQHVPALSPPPLGFPDMWFNASFPPRENISFNPSFPLLDTRPLGSSPDKPPDERKVKLGKTLHILQDRLPTLLQNPLPQEILSPNISLHLFPSTHPHLPAVSGRVAYIAALWTSPIAWNRVPVIGNVKLEIITARMVSARPVNSAPWRTGAVGESLVVRWKTIGKGSKGSIWGLSSLINGNGNGMAQIGGAGSGEKEFTGLFIFDFDNEGRILSHTIEHVEQGGHWEKGVGAKMVGLTDWLLGGIRGNGSDTPIPAACSSLEKKE